MPTYSIRNKITGDEFELFMKISELDTFKEENPHLETFPTGAPAIGDPFRLGRMKPSDNFCDRLKEIKKTHAHSTITVPK